MTPRRDPTDDIIGGEEVPRELDWARSHRLDDWMSRMEEKVDGLRTDMAGLMSVKERVDEHHERIYGNGSPGLIKDVDRLKQWRSNLRWVIAAVLIPGIAAAADLIAHLVSR